MEYDEYLWIIWLLLSFLFCNYDKKWQPALADLKSRILWLSNVAILAFYSLLRKLLFSVSNFIHSQYLVTLLLSNDT
jgi:hypothetical protein